MRGPSRGMILGAIAVAVFALAWGTPAPAGGEVPQGWTFPTIGSLNGTWELSVGAHLWADHFDLRNLQLRADIDLAPGLRWHALARSNRLLNGLGEWEPRLDERPIAFGAGSEDPEALRQGVGPAVAHNEAPLGRGVGDEQLRVESGPGEQRIE